MSSASCLSTVEAVLAVGAAVLLSGGVLLVCIASRGGGSGREGGQRQRRPLAAPSSPQFATSHWAQAETADYAPHVPCPMLRSPASAAEKRNGIAICPSTRFDAMRRRGRPERPASHPVRAAQERAGRVSDSACATRGGSAPPPLLRETWRHLPCRRPPSQHVGQHARQDRRRTDGGVALLHTYIMWYVHIWRRADPPKTAPAK